MATNKIQEFIDENDIEPTSDRRVARIFPEELQTLFRSLYEEIMKESPSHTDIRGNGPIPRSHVRRSFESFGIPIPQEGK